MLIHEVSIPEKGLRDRYNLFVVNLFQMLPLVVAAQPTGICSLHQNDTVQHQRAVRPPVENDISRLQRAAVSGCELHPAAALLQKRPHTGAGNRDNGAAQLPQAAFQIALLQQYSSIRQES